MKGIIYISPHTDKYGAERSMISNIKNIKNHGISVLVVIPQCGRIEELLKQEKINYIIEKFYDVINHEGHSRLHYGIVKNIVNIYKAHKLKNIIEHRDICPILVHSNSITSDFGIILSKILKIPHIQHIRELGKYDFGMTFDMGIKHFARMCAKSEKIICISNTIFNYYKKYLPEEKMVRIYNGVQVLNNTNKKVLIRYDNELLRLVIVGRLSKEKGQIQAIKAVQKLISKANIHLDIWGDGVDEELLQEYIKNNKLERYVSLCGYSNRIPLSNYHVALMCSKYEAFGRVTVEYMLNYLPVIGVKSGGTKEIVLDNITGILYENGDIDNLVYSIERLLYNEKLRQNMAIAGRNRVEQKFSEEIYCNNIYEEYKKISSVFK